MPRFVAQCPKCEHKESVISTGMTAEMPPCPRCEDFVRMADVTPGPDETTTTYSTAGSQQANAEPAAPLPQPAPAPKRRDMRDFGPEPRA